MQIIEVKNNIAKISYNSVNNHLLPSDFLLIQDNSLKFIAQVISIETTEDSVLNVANLRLALFIDSEDNLSFYNGYIIGKSAKVNYISPDEIIELICDDKNNIYFGNLFNSPQTFVKTNFSFVDDKLYIQSDKTDKTNVLVKNIVSQLISNDKKVVILDFDNQYKNVDNAVTLKITKDLKLPLNLLALDNLIDKDIEDCPIEDRVFIQSVILELREYIQTLPDKFLQFNLFRDVIDAQYKENQIVNLMALRNKLWLYAQNNLFANDKSEFDTINSVLQENNCVIIDASEVGSKWQNFVIQFLNEIISEKCYFFVEFDGLNIDKKFINDFYNTDKITPIVCSSYNNPCRNILSLLSKNQILCKPSIFIDENVQYIDYLNRLNIDEFIIFGEATLYLPLIINLQEFDSSTMQTVLENDIKRDVDKLLSGSSSSLENVEATIAPALVEVEETSVNEEVIQQKDEEEIKEDIIEEIKEEINENVQEETLVENNIIDDDLTQSDLDFLDEMFLEEKEEQIEEDNSSNIDVVDEQIESVETEEENSIEGIDEITDVQEVQFEEQSEEQPEEEVIEELVEVEQDITADDELELLDTKEETMSNKTPGLLMEEDEFFEVQESEQEEVLIQEENLENSEDEVENEDTEQEEYTEEVEYIDEESQETEEELLDIDETIDEKENPNLVVYETDVQQKINQEELPFNVGDKVYHPKHGNGIVQGFTNYSDKILFCQIEFENVGRRILDPRVAQLEKV